MEPEILVRCLQMICTRPRTQTDTTFSRPIYLIRF